MLNLLTSPIFYPFNVKEMTYFFMGLYGSHLNHNWGRNRKAQKNTIHSVMIKSKTYLFPYSPTLTPRASQPEHNNLAFQSTSEVE